MSACSGPTPSSLTTQLERLSIESSPPTVWVKKQTTFDLILNALKNPQDLTSLQGTKKQAFWFELLDQFLDSAQHQLKPDQLLFAYALFFELSPKDNAISLLIEKLCEHSKTIAITNEPLQELAPYSEVRHRLTRLMPTVQLCNSLAKKLQFFRDLSLKCFSKQASEKTQNQAIPFQKWHELTIGLQAIFPFISLWKSNVSATFVDWISKSQRSTVEICSASSLLGYLLNPPQGQKPISLELWKYDPTASFFLREYALKVIGHEPKKISKENAHAIMALIRAYIVNDKPIRSNIWVNFDLPDFKTLLILIAASGHLDPCLVKSIALSLLKSPKLCVEKAITGLSIISKLSDFRNCKIEEVEELLHALERFIANLEKNKTLEHHLQDLDSLFQSLSHQTWNLNCVFGAKVQHLSSYDIHTKDPVSPFACARRILTKLEELHARYNLEGIKIFLIKMKGQCIRLLVTAAQGIKKFSTDPVNQPALFKKIQLKNELILAAVDTLSSVQSAALKQELAPLLRPFVATTISRFSHELQVIDHNSHVLIHTTQQLEQLNIIQKTRIGNQQQKTVQIAAHGSFPRMYKWQKPPPSNLAQA